jgi:hypothetical protein
MDSERRETDRRVEIDLVSEAARLYLRGEISAEKYFHPGEPVRPTGVHWHSRPKRRQGRSTAGTR